MNNINYINRTEFMEPRQGEIYLAKVCETDSVGCEIQKARPVLILSGDLHNRERDMVFVVPLSKIDTKKVVDVSLSVIIEANKSNGLSNDSITVVEQAKSISKQRLRRYLGVENRKVLNEVYKTLLRYCDINVLYL